jgi:hypothetical protein
MKNRRALAMLMAASALVCLATPSLAQAQDACGEATYLLPSQRIQTFIVGDSTLFFKTRVTAGRSYSILAWAPSQDASEGGAHLVLGLSTDCSAGIIGPDGPHAEPHVELVPGHMGDDKSFTPEADGTLYIALGNRISTDVTVGYDAHLMLIETTLFSPWWFTGGTNQAFIEMRNNMSGPTTAVLTLYRADGTVCGSGSLELAGNGNAAVDAGSLGTCAAAVSGSAQIAYSGTPGGMAANITTIDVPNGTSFDAPFKPRMSWTTFSRQTLVQFLPGVAK